VLFVNNKYKWKNIMQKMNGLLTWSGRHSCLLMAFLQIGLFFQQVKASDLPQITNLRTEYKINPLGIDAAQPRFSWEIVSGKRNFTQKAFQIRASKLEKDLLEGKNLMWDSGKILSDFKAMPL
jgi:hypothetical protein